jgi:CO dehydrogenase/CO-methylating acetyl-CoA synthase complex beta subunit
MTENRLALIIASYEYQDDSLRRLVSPAQDAEALARVLRDPDIGGFDEVKVLINRPSHEVRLEIASFFADRKRNDLLLLYFSGHGVKDDDGRLYLATTDTQRKLLRATAVPAAFTNETMNDSRSRRQVLVLDCCHSGAFARTKADMIVGIKERVGGRGRVVLTSSNAVQYSFEGDEAEGEGVRSVFTRVLVQGLETGDADRDRDGYVSLDELYEYVYDHVIDETPKQRPQMFATVEGKIFIAHNPALLVSKGVLPGWITEALTSSAFSARLAAVGELAQLSQGQDQALASIARIELERLSQKDEHLTVRGAAAGALGISLVAVSAQPPLTLPALPEKTESEPTPELRPSLVRGLSFESQTMDTGGEIVWGKVTNVPVPVLCDRTSVEIVRRADMRIELGGKNSRAFEYLCMASINDVEDGKIEIIGPDFEDIGIGGSMDFGIVIEVAGRKMQEDFEPVLERQVHFFIDAASGIQHIGQRDIVWIRISKAAAEKGFRLRHFGDILYTRFHEDLGAIVDKVQVKIITDPQLHSKWLERARAAYTFRNHRVANLTDEKVDTFYSCVLCQLSAPTHVCIVSPQRLGMCGAYDWLDCKVSFRINPMGPSQPILKGKCLDPEKGYFTGVNECIRTASRGSLEQISMYSMENPMTTCSCCECIVAYIPEVKGVMVANRGDSSMTPAGMTFSTLVGMAEGMQVPGIMGVGKFYLSSPKFISADGGFKRVVWMSSFLKESMACELQVVGEREGYPKFLDKVADETICTDVEGLFQFLREKGHPALSMPPMPSQWRSNNG